MARVLPVLCALFFFFALACGQITFTTNVRIISFDPVDSKIAYELQVVNTGAVGSAPVLTVKLDGVVNNKVVVVSPDTTSMDVEVSLPDVIPVQTKTKSKAPQRTSNPPKPTSKPSVSAAFGTEFSPVMAIISLAAAGLCRGLTQNNRLSFGLFIVVAVVLAIAAQTDAASKVEVKKILATVVIPSDWITQDGPTLNKTIKKVFELFLFPPSVVPSVAAASSSAPASRTPTASVSPSVSHF